MGQDQRRPAAPRITTTFEIYGASSITDLGLLQGMGFNQVILDFRWLAPIADELGLGVVLANWWGRSTSAADIEEVVQIAAGLEHLVSINMMDEPNDNGVAEHPPSAYRRIRRIAHAGGWAVPLSLTIYGPREEWPACWTRLFLDYVRTVDILRIDPYPIAGRKPLGLVTQWIERARGLMRLAGRPVPLTAAVEVWDSGLGLPSIDQVRVMAYQALLSGADVVSFYNYNATAWGAVGGYVEGFRALMAELTELAAEFAGARAVGLLGGDGVFEAELRRDGRCTCFRVNTSGRPAGRLAGYQVARRDGRGRLPLGAGRHG